MMLERRQEFSQRKARLARFIAALMLILFLPAGVFAGPLRYCLGDNGHQGIELAHSGNSRHGAFSEKYHLADAGPALPDVQIQHSRCRDTLLIPVVAKSEKRLAKTLSRNPTSATHPRLSLATRANTQELASAHIPVAPLRAVDPRLVTLRTIVLRN